MDVIGAVSDGYVVDRRGKPTGEETSTASSSRRMVCCSNRFVLLSAVLEPKQNLVGHLPIRCELPDCPAKQLLKPRSGRALEARGAMSTPAPRSGRLRRVS